MQNLVVKTTPLFTHSLSEKVKAGNKKVIDRFEEFLKSKKENAMQPFGKSDKPFISGGFIRNAIPNETLLHAHLTHDVSIIYSLSGKDPKILKLYGVFSHDEMGTGQPANLKKQKQLASKLSNAGQAS